MYRLLIAFQKIKLLPGDVYHNLDVPYFIFKEIIKRNLTALIYTRAYVIYTQARNFVNLIVSIYFHLIT